MDDREAARKYLAQYAELATVERTLRRREVAAVPILTAAAVGNLAVGVAWGWQPSDLASYGAAAWVGVCLQRVLLFAYYRRRFFVVMTVGAIEARRRLGQ